MIRKNLIFLHLKIQSIYFTDLMILLKRTEILDTNYFTPKKMLDSVGLKKVEDKNKQFLIEKIIHGVEFENLHQSNPEKTLK